MTADLKYCISLLLLLQGAGVAGPGPRGLWTWPCDLLWPSRCRQLQGTEGLAGACAALSECSPETTMCKEAGLGHQTYEATRGAEASQATASNTAGTCDRGHLGPNIRLSGHLTAGTHVSLGETSKEQSSQPSTLREVVNDSCSRPLCSGCSARQTRKLRQGCRMK